MPTNSTTRLAASHEENRRHESFDRSVDFMGHFLKIASAAFKTGDHYHTTTICVSSKMRHSLAMSVCDTCRRSQSLRDEPFVRSRHRPHHAESRRAGNAYVVIVPPRRLT
jgi:hypothetical protein